MSTTSVVEAATTGHTLLKRVAFTVKVLKDNHQLGRCLGLDLIVQEVNNAQFHQRLVAPHIPFTVRFPSTHSCFENPYMQDVYLLGLVWCWTLSGGQQPANPGTICPYKRAQFESLPKYVRQNVVAVVTSFCLPVEDAFSLAASIDQSLNERLGYNREQLHDHNDEPSGLTFQ